MSSALKSITVEISGDITKLTRAFREAKAEGTILKKHLGEIDKYLKFDPTGIEGITKKQQLLTKAVEQNRAAHADLSAQMAEYKSKFSDLSDAERRQLEKLEQELTRLDAQYEELLDSAIRFGAGASAETLALKATYENLGTTLTNIGNKLTVASAATAFVGYNAIQAAIDFESSFTGVYKTVDATADQFDRLREASREMALTKPIDVNDINYAMELGGQLGIAADNLEKFAGTMADLAVAAPSLTIEDASMKLAQFMNITNMAESDVDRLGAVITDLGNNSATTEYKIMNMALRIAGSGSNIGLTAQEILALATSLSAVGIEAEMGGNAISTIMNRIDKDVALNTDTLQTWADTAGMSVQEFTAAWENSDTVMDAMMAVVDGMANYRDEGGNLNTLLADMNISYMRQIDTMQRLSRTGELVNDMMDHANTAWDENVALTREANRRYETTESQLQLVKNNMNELGIQMGTLMLPTIKDLSQGAVELMQAFGEMDDETRQNIINIGLLVTAAGPATLAMGTYFKAISKVIGAYASAKTQVNLLTTGTIDGKKATDEHTRALQKQEAATQRATAAEKAKNSAMAAGKAVAGLAAVAILYLAVDAIGKYIEEQQNMRKATQELASTVGLLDSATTGASEAINRMKTDRAQASLGQLREEIDKTIEAQADLADRSAETFTSLATNNAIVDEAIAVIERLGNQYDDNGTAIQLNAAQQGELASAVSLLNEVCGTSYEIIDQQTGKLSESNEVIKENTEAWRRNAETQAMANLMADAKSRQIELDYELAQASEKKAALEREYNQAMEDGNILLANSILPTLAEAEEAYNLASDALEENAKYQEYLTDAQIKSTAAYEQMIAYVSMFGDSVAEAFTQAGVAQEDFILEIARAGVSVEDFQTLTDEQLGFLIENFDGTYDSIADLMSAFVAQNRRGGADAASKFAEGLNSEQQRILGAAAAIYGLTVDQFAGLAGALGYEGQEAVLEFVDGILSGEPDARWGASVIAAAAKEMTAGDYATWGYHLVQALANGMSLAKSLTTTVASNIASGIRSILGHSVPKEGPLHNHGKGEIEWGEHLIQNLIQGMENEEAALRAKAASLGDIVAGELNPNMASSTMSALLGFDSSIANAVNLMNGQAQQSAQPQSITYITGDIHLTAQDVRDVKTIDDVAKVIKQAKLMNPTRR